MMISAVPCFECRIIFVKEVSGRYFFSHRGAASGQYALTTTKSTSFKRGGEGERD